MSNTHFFYAQRAGKSFSNFNQSPLYFKMYSNTDPVKVQVSLLDENEKATHFGWLNSDGKIELIYQKEDELRLQLKDDIDILESKLVGKCVRLLVEEYISEAA